MRGKLAKLTAIALGLGATALSVPLVGGFFGSIHPAFDSLAHFRIHLAAGLAAAALLLFFFKGWRLNAAIALALACAATVVTTGLPVGGLRAEASGTADLPRYRLLHMNLRFDNPQPEKVFSLIGEVRPDVVTLNEVSTLWRGRLAVLEAAYPHRILCPHRARIGGSAILSRRPFTEAGARCENGGSLAVAAIDFGGETVEVAALHLGWPWPFDQPWQVRKLVPLLGKLGDRAILAGDLNATPWSASVRRVAEAGGLMLTRWVGPSWLDRRAPAALRPWVGLPIDHVMTKGGVLAEKPRRLPEAGSDHLPVLLEFSLLPEEDAPPVMRAAVEGNKAIGQYGNI